MNSNSGRGPIREIHHMVSKNGIGSLWKGVGPAVTRASALTASQLAAYDETKQVCSSEAPFFTLVI